MIAKGIVYFDYTHTHTHTLLQILFYKYIYK